MDELVGEDGPDDVSDKGSPSTSRNQQAALFKHLDRITEAWPRHIQQLGEFPLGRKTVTRSQHAFDNQIFYVPHDGIRDFFVLDLAENHCRNPLLPWLIDDWPNLTTA